MTPSDPNGDDLEPLPAIMWGNRGLGCLVIALVSATFFGGLVSITARPSSPLGPMLFVGFLTAEYCTIAIWAVLGSQRLLIRAVFAVLALNVGWATILLGAMVGESMHGWGGIPPDEVWRIWLLSPLVLLISCVPLVIFRGFTGRLWRIDAVGRRVTFSRQGAGQFGVGELLGVTGLVAGCLVCFRLAYAVWDRTPDTNDWLMIAWVGLIAAALTTFAAIPCVWAVMIGRSAKAFAAVTLIGYAITVIFILMSLSGVLAGSPRGEASIAIGGFVIATIGCLTLILLILVGCGYRLFLRHAAPVAIDANRDEPARDDQRHHRGTEAGERES